MGGDNIFKVGIEAATIGNWRQYIGKDGVFVGMSDFGSSAKAEDLYKHFEITADVACDKVIAELKSRRRAAIQKYKDKDDLLDELEKYKEEVRREVEGEGEDDGE